MHSWTFGAGETIYFCTGETVSVERKLTNQDAFDIAVLHLLNQGNGCFNATGQSRHRGPRGKSAVGALIPDHVYAISMERRTIQQMLAASGTEYGPLRERLGGVTTALLNELQDLHDRIGACLPSLFRHLVLAGSYRIAQAFGLSARMVHLWVAYQGIHGPRIVLAAAAESESPAPHGRTPQMAQDRSSEALQMVA
jgi:hypothetical protein